jgi:hypothetical protein
MRTIVGKRGSWRPGRLLALALLGAVWSGLAWAKDAAPTARQLYNQGTQKLNERKLREAEASLQGAVATQDQRVQSPALYNLGVVRFGQGVEELKSGPDGKATARRGDQAAASGEEAIRMADAALADPDMTALVQAYLRGRGARKGMKEAAEAVKRALESYGTVLGKWERASGDFKSAHELRSTDEDARHNADVVDRSIARLVDTQQMMMQSQDSLKKTREQLGKKMKELKGKMTKEQQQQCKDGEEEDEEEDEEDQKPKEPKEGHQEPKPKEGRELPLTPEEAARLLEQLRLDADRKLPLGMKDTGQNKDKQRRNW